MYPGDSATQVEPLMEVYTLNAERLMTTRNETKLTRTYVTSLKKGERLFI